MSKSVVSLSKSDDELKVLGKYSGFGGLKFILNEASVEADADKWSKSEKEYFTDTLELHRLIGEYSKNDRKAREYMDSLRTSVLMESSFRATTQFSNIPATAPIADDAMVFPHNASLSALNIMRLISDRAEPKHEGKQTANVSPCIRP